MTRKDYELVAAVVRSLPANTSRMDVAKAFRTKFSNTFPNFDWSKFMAAATLSGDKW